MAAAGSPAPRRADHPHRRRPRLLHTKPRLILAAPWLFARHTHGLTPPYYLPAGGSSPLGTLGAVETALELGTQVETGELPEPARLVTPVGSGGTSAGLALGLRLAGPGAPIWTVPGPPPTRSASRRPGWETATPTPPPPATGPSPAPRRRPA
ncbi:pyridoxal-phosphate dependent enzyme [Streptomyces sp. NPDC002463]|uniref:pyridoxal-phosphate dependent enzyme n=1 Tax=Streptomyces sp. NPDC002463 TaxID=3364645 RepID=UPI0036BE3316